MSDQRKDPGPFFVMDAHGKVLVLQCGAPIFVEVTEIHEQEALLFDKERALFMHDGCAYRLRAGFRSVHCERASQPQQGLLTEGERFLSIGYNSEYISAAPDGSLFTTFRREIWERFFLLSSSLLHYLRCILRHGVTVNGRPIQQISFQRFRLHLDEESYCLERNDDLSLSVAENFLMRDNLAMDRATHFNPVVYYCAFERRDVLLSAVLCAKSVIRNSGVSFSIVIFTDIDEPARDLDLTGLERIISFVNCDVFGYTDIFFFRYSLFVLDRLRDYNLVYYSDSDIICNKSLIEMVERTLESEKICVNIEFRVKNASEGGWFISDFMRRDEKIAGQTILPINSGFFGFSSTEAFEKVVRFMAKVKGSLNRFHYKNSYSYDQSVFNYALISLDLIDDDAIAAYIVNWPPAAFADIPRSGLVHFCGGLGEFASRLAKMESYIAYVEPLMDNADAILETEQIELTESAPQGLP
ncbi:glycosyltransferase family protein [Asaia platycodi]|uniref:hypothetical protein n=1 Tax=Asaia platycodi TaxID=610243 RepID=UPI0011DDA5AB|nr:hypothetical protein [Asaia platycodi]